MYSPGLVGRIKATRYMREYGLDFDDALAVQAMEGLSIDAIVSYDRRFDAVNWVERATPEELLSMHGGGGKESEDVNWRSRGYPNVRPPR